MTSLQPVDLGDERIIRLDRKVDQAEDDGIRARWAFGREMLTRRGGKDRLPNGELVRVSILTGKSEREIGYRMQFAERCADEGQLRNAVAEFGSWHRIVAEFLPPSAPEPVPSPSRVPSLMASTTVEVFTPAKYVDAARTVLGVIDLDPASCEEANRTVKAERFFSIADDGLSREWFGRVWMNPPWGASTTGAFVTKLVEEFDAGRVTSAVLLLSALGFTSSWFQPLWDHTLCFASKRIDFDGASPPFGSVFAYLGPNRQRFVEAFDQFGAVVNRERPHVG
jgi:hypothetical protein